jgi:hypothetical protein
MDKQQAQELIKETFERSFDVVRFTNFIKNLLNRIDDASQIVSTYLFNRIKYAS